MPVKFTFWTELRDEQKGEVYEILAVGGPVILTLAEAVTVAHPPEAGMV